MDNVTNCLMLDRWSDLENSSSHETLEQQILPAYLQQRRWFSGKSQTIQSVTIAGEIAIPGPLIPPYLWLLQVEYTNGSKEKYLLPVCFIPGRQMPEEQMRPPVLCSMQVGLESGWLCDANWCEDFRLAMFRHLALQSDIEGNGSRLHFSTSQLFHRVQRDQPRSRLMNAEQSNTSIVYDNSLFFKLYRKVETGINPDVELSRFLTEEAHFSETPPWMGEVEWQTPEGLIQVGILQQFIPQSTVGWNYFMPMIKLAVENPEGNNDQLFRKVEQLGELSGSLHNALLPQKDADGFAPEWFDVEDQEELRARVMSELNDSFNMLRQNINKLPPEARTMGLQLLESQQDLAAILKETYTMSSNAMKIRLHGDLHLGQVLVANDRFFITDFEGEPGRCYEERRVKQSPVKDIAGMIRSFHYAVYSAKLSQAGNPEDETDYMPVENLLHRMTDAYVASYMKACKMDVSENELQGFLRLFMIEKALYELRYEINNRPDWAIIPIAGLKAQVREWMGSHAHHV
jgi:maltose alpha-D-glucosyltransferase/alpha-amylase